MRVKISEAEYEYRKRTQKRCGCLECADVQSNKLNPTTKNMICSHAPDGIPAIKTCPYAEDVMKYPSYNAYVKANPYRIYAHADSFIKRHEG